ncbi:MAG: HEPN domain-containing protein [bacterium]
MKHPVEKWLLKAEAVHHALEVLAEHGDISADVLVYLSLLSAELHLKTVIALGDEVPPKSHSLRALFGAAREVTLAMEPISGTTMALDQYSHAVRYPEYWSDPLDGERAYRWATEIRNFVGALLP